MLFWLCSAPLVDQVGQPDQTRISFGLVISHVDRSTPKLDQSGRLNVGCVRIKAAAKELKSFYAPKEEIHDAPTVLNSRLYGMQSGISCCLHFVELHFTFYSSASNTTYNIGKIGVGTRSSLANQTN